MPDTPPHTLRWPLMRQRWLDLTYLHWEVDPDEVASRLPDGLEPDLFDGTAWVGLVPFQMRDIGLPVGPGMPYFGTFPETNVRTYVTGPHGPGVWFDSLDATRLAPVAMARAAFGLPYMWSSMSIEREPDTIRYRTRRRWGGPRAASDVSVRIGRPVLATDLDVFLSARWRLYTSWFGRVMHAPVEHPPWVLREATATVHDGLVAVAGYTISGEPLVRYSHGVPVRVGRPRFVR
jgi:uncharacterized protein YqjF (DUF2071 family)